VAFCDVVNYYILPSRACCTHAGKPASVNRGFTVNVGVVIVGAVADADAPTPTFTRAPSGVSFCQFRPLMTDDVISAIRRLPDKTSAADHIPTSVLKQTADVVAPFVTELFNRSLSTGHFSAGSKEAFITPTVKKPGPIFETS